MTDLDIRESQHSDHAMITGLYPVAFPEEDLLAVVRALLGASEGVLSLVAIKGFEFVGHVAFTDCKIDGARAKVAMLAPLAVAPAFQRQGVGSALVRSGLLRLREKDVSH
ncbi:MAG: GNAT family N-acetyltransferase, partial [Pseudomonadota bacterium]